MEQARGIIVKTLTILAGFWLSDLAAARIQDGIAAGESMERIIDGMTTMLQHPLALGFDRTSLLCGLGGACAVGLFHLYRWSTSQRNWRDGEEYGSARWWAYSYSSLAWPRPSPRPSTSGRPPPNSAEA